MKNLFLIVIIIGFSISSCSLDDIKSVRYRKTKDTSTFILNHNASGIKQGDTLQVMGDEVVVDTIMEFTVPKEN